MDPVRAARMSEELTGRSVGGWNIINFMGAGKSALVFEAEQNGTRAALKVFDPELVERFGKDTQLTRIDRERSLIGESHPNLVAILGGGECPLTGYLFVAMEFIDAPNLASALTLVPRDKIASLIQQVASAARFLEDRALAHRDIKPENIAVLQEFSRAVLLDLGVLRPFGDPRLTDEDARVFVGTLQYSSPEFLLRTEQDTREGWRAIAFYQLGAVLHDLIMRRPLFKEFVSPFAVLVEAVKSEMPEISSDEVHADLILLAQNCLVKSPDARLTLVTWDDFESAIAPRHAADGVRERVKKRALLSRAQLQDGAPPRQPPVKQLSQRIADQLDSVIRNECTGNDAFPPIEIIPTFDLQTRVLVKFAAAPPMAYPLGIRFDCDLIDEASMALTVATAACILPPSGEFDAPPNSTTIFRGPLDSSNLTTRVQDVLWHALDLAQQQTLPPGGEQRSIWLDLAHSLEVDK